MTNTRKRQPTAHRLFRRQRGPLTIAPFPYVAPQYQTGARFGQQLALIRKADRP